jgi:CheY-like chemotaxis protein
MARILIVEDERIIAEDLKISLRNFGYDIIAIVSSGEDAIKKAEELCPDLMLMDIALQGDIDGIEAAEKIHEKSDIPIVYLTAYSNGDILEKAKQTRPYAYLVKPFHENELRTKIEIALHEHEMEPNPEKVSGHKSDYKVGSA